MFDRMVCTRWHSYFPQDGGKGAAGNWHDDGGGFVGLDGVM